MFQELSLFLVQSLQAVQDGSENSINARTGMPCRVITSRSRTAQEPEDVDVVLGGTVLSNYLNIDELARGTPPQTRKLKKSPWTLCFLRILVK